MNGIEGFVVGMIIGIVSTVMFFALTIVANFTGIMLFTKYMNKKQKDLYMKMGIDKLMKNDA